MEITLLCIYTAFTFLIYYLIHLSYDGDHPSLRTIELRLFAWIFFIGLGIFQFSILYLIPNGSPASLTPYVITRENYQYALMFGFIGFGFIQLGMAVMDAIEYRSYHQSMKDEDDEWERQTEISFGD